MSIRPKPDKPPKNVRTQSGSVDDAQGTITRDLQDLTVDVLRREVEQLTKRINAYVAERPEEPPLPANGYETAKQVAVSQGALR